jgi:tetratricopeptide (TPR) repeat protein
MQPRPDTRFWAALLAVGVVALCLRCVYLWQIHDAPFFDLRIGDGAAYHQWARRIADGDWLGTGVFYQAPLYPYFLALVYRFLDDSTTTVRLVQAFLGAESCALLAAAGMSLFGRRGALAGLGLAVYPPAIFLDGLIEKSPLVTLLTTALLALLAVPAERMTPRRRFATGIILGLLALTRENALLLAIPILCWLLWQHWRWTAALLPVAGCALVLLPIGLRNLAVGGEFHLTTAQFGPNFYIGNHAGADGTYQALVIGHGSAVDEREDATRLAEQARGRNLSPGEVSHFWTQRSWEYIRSQPLAWLRLTARKVALTFNAAEVSDTESQEVYAEWSWLLRLLRPFDFGVVFGLAAMGTALTARSWRRLWFLYALISAYALSLALFYVFARYRFPLVPVLMVLAAGGIVPAPRRELALAAVVAILALALSHLRLDDPRRSSAIHYANIASALAKDPQRLDAALRFYQRALETDPKFPAAQFGLGVVLARSGRPQEAIPYYQAALSSWPDYAEAHYDLGMALGAIGQSEDAAREFTEALRLHPHDPDTHFALAKALLALNRPEQAAEHYRQGLVSRPKDGKALVGWGVALTQLGRPEDAIQKYRLALELDPSDAAAHTSLGWTLASQGHLSEAVPHFERALKLKPDDATARKNLERARQILKN